MSFQPRTYDASVGDRHMAELFRAGMKLLNEPAPSADIRFSEAWPCVVIAFATVFAMAVVA